MSSKENKIHSNEEVFDNLYNFENEQARLDKLDKEAQTRYNLNSTYLDEEKTPDENAESEMIRNADEAIRREREKKSESDPFEYSQTLIKLHEGASKSEKDNILNKISIFTESYRKIIKDESINIEQQEIEAKKLFDKTFGKLIYGYNSETDSHSLGTHQTEGYINVKNKKAPVDAYRQKYDSRGRAIDPDAPIKKDDRKKNQNKPKKRPNISNIFTNNIKFPFRKKK